MANLRRVNRYNQEILDQYSAYGLDPNGLRKKHGLPFVVKLFRYLWKHTKKSKKALIDPIFPKNYSDHYLAGSGITYIEELQDAGLKLKVGYEDFIDEDTGEVVSIQRFKFKPLKFPV